MSLLSKLRGAFLDLSSDEDKALEEQELKATNYRPSRDKPLRNRNTPSPHRQPNSAHFDGCQTSSSRIGSGNGACVSEVKTPQEGEDRGGGGGGGGGGEGERGGEGGGGNGIEDAVGDLSVSDDHGITFTRSVAVTAVPMHHTANTSFSLPSHKSTKMKTSAKELGTIQDIDTYLVLSASSVLDTETPSPDQTYTFIQSQLAAGQEGEPQTSLTRHRGEGEEEVGGSSFSAVPGSGVEETDGAGGGMDSLAVMSPVADHVKLPTAAQSQSLPACGSGNSLHETNPEKEDQSSKGIAINFRSCSDLPERMKNAQAVIYNGELHVGGGYTKRPKLDAKVYAYDENYDMWNELPASCLLKWFGMAVFRGQLVAIGGKETVGGRGNISNKLATWDSDKAKWSFSLPPMSTARASPVTFSHGPYLVVASGRKGVLDYNVEVYSEESGRWSQVSPLPLPCSSHTSLVHDGYWYLLNQGSRDVHFVDVQSIVDQVDSTSSGEHHGPEVTQQPSPKWRKLPSLCSAASDSVPFRITSVGQFIVTFCRINSEDSSPLLYAYYPQPGDWYEIGCVLPTCANAGLARLPSNDLMVFGGDSGDYQYSNKSYRLSLDGLNQKNGRKVGIKMIVTFHT